MKSVKIKRVYEDGPVLFIHPRENVVYLFNGEKYQNTYKVEDVWNGERVYEELLKKPCECEYQDYVLTAELSDRVLQLIENK